MRLAHFRRSRSAGACAPLVSRLNERGTSPRATLHDCVSQLLGTAGDSRQNRDRVPRPERRFEATEVPDVLVVHVDIDELAKFASCLKQTRLDARELAGQVGE